MDTQTWPDVLHRKELPGLVQILTPFGTNRHMFWRTAWIGQAAADYLKIRHVDTFAITFDWVPSPPRAVSEKNLKSPAKDKRGEDKDHHKGGGPSRFKTWSKKVLRKLSGMDLRAERA